MQLSMIKMHKGQSRQKRGYAIAESAAAITVVLPIILLVTFACIEVSQAFLIMAGLKQAAYTAAREIAINYGNNPTAAQSASGTLGYDAVLSNVNFLNIVNSSQQFQTPTFNLASTPHSVTVVCQYQSGQHKLPAFPGLDPLHLSNQFSLSATSTVNLE